MAVAENSKLARLLRKFHVYMKRQYDVCICIVGGEGKGKSRGLLLPIIDYWYKSILNRPVKTNSLGVSFEAFATALKTGEEFDICALDEAGEEMDRENHRNTLNTILFQAYTVIREKLFFTILVLPDFFDLNPRFRKRRVRGVFEVYKRKDYECTSCGWEFVQRPECPKCQCKKIKKGYILWRYYSRQKLDEIIAKNQSRLIKRLSVVKPTYSGKSYKYDGPLLKPYAALKKGKMDDAINRIDKITNTVEVTSNVKCPACESKDTRYVKKTDSMACRRCGNEWKKD